MGRRPDIWQPPLPTKTSKKVIMSTYCHYPLTCILMIKNYFRKMGSSNVPDTIYSICISNNRIALLLGVICGLIGFNIGHDAIHGGYSTKGWVNNLLGQTFTAVGA